MTTRNIEELPVDSALDFLVNAARVSPVLRAKVQIVEDEIRRLKRWKSEATTVLNYWDIAYEMANIDGRLGDNKPTLVVGEIERLRGEVERLNGLLAAHHGGMWATCIDCGMDLGGPQIDLRPHSRACGFRRHEHGPDCHARCPTCGGAS